MQNSSLAGGAKTGVAGARAQLPQTAYPPQQPATEHTNHAPKSPAATMWHTRHISLCALRLRPSAQNDTSACPFAHSREKSTFLGQMSPSSSSHSTEGLCLITLKFAGENVPRTLGRAPSASILTVTRAVCELISPQITPVRPFISGLDTSPATTTRDPFPMPCAAGTARAGALAAGGAGSTRAACVAL